MLMLNSKRSSTDDKFKWIDFVTIYSIFTGGAAVALILVMLSLDDTDTDTEPTVTLIDLHVLKFHRNDSVNGVDWGLVREHVSTNPNFVFEWSAAANRNAPFTSITRVKENELSAEHKKDAASVVMDALRQQASVELIIAGKHSVTPYIWSDGDSSSQSITTISEDNGRHSFTYSYSVGGTGGELDISIDLALIENLNTGIDNSDDGATKTKEFRFASEVLLTAGKTLLLSWDRIRDYGTGENEEGKPEQEAQQQFTRELMVLMTPTITLEAK